MAATPEPPPADRSERPPAHAENGAGEARKERCGPLAVERHAKDDGRALILYARHAPERP